MFRTLEQLHCTFFFQVDLAIWLRSCIDEVSVPKRGQLIGRIPKWVKGDLLMNGPGKFYYGTDVFQHLFDGSALIQKYAIAEDGEVYYQCKFLRTKSFVQVGKTDFISNLVQTQFLVKFTIYVLKQLLFFFQINSENIVITNIS